MLALGISRATAYSPGVHASNDQLLLELTGAALIDLGWTVELVSENDLPRALPETPYIFSMCQGPVAIARLKRLEAGGRIIVNSPRAVEGCYRVRLFRRLRRLRHDRGACPETHIVRTGKALPPIEWLGQSAAWVKRGDVHSTCADDVQRVGDRSTLDRVLDGFKRRGIPSAIVQRHVDGMVVKFYGVVGSGFFRSYSEGDPQFCSLPVDRAQGQIERLVERLGLEIYGGDCVVAPDGRISIIDINDWPSFAFFRHDAARAIARHLDRRFEAHAAQSPRSALAASSRERAVVFGAEHAAARDGRDQLVNAAGARR